MMYEFLKSWKCTEGSVNSTDELMNWMRELIDKTHADVNERSIHDDTFWFYDDYRGEVLNRKRSFFSIIGMRRFKNGEFVDEQPIIVQPEIGYLGIICKKINGIINFLMQAKIEPGNVNCVQISPTIQATKSNFMRAHGGRLPAYFSYFENSAKYHVIYDQVQSEQAARFYKKRNRNMIMLVDEDIEVLPNFKWMTLGQLKKMLEVENLVNMDTRTVLSGIPFSCGGISEDEKKEAERIFSDKALFNSMFSDNFGEELPQVYSLMNNFKMFQDVNVVSVPLNQLVDWNVDEYGITCKKPADFAVRYYDINISGREVHHWTQPLFKAVGRATFGLFTKTENGVRKYLVKLKDEIGSFDKVELGPCVQLEASHSLSETNPVEILFQKKLMDGCAENSILTDILLSEEGGRFFHEQNRNVILEIENDELPVLPNGYVWVSYSTLNRLVQINNCLNIQLRNLISLIGL